MQAGEKWPVFTFSRRGVPSPVFEVSSTATQVAKTKWNVNHREGKEEGYSNSRLMQRPYQP